MLRNLARFPQRRKENLQTYLRPPATPLLLAELGDKVLDHRAAVRVYTEVGRVVAYAGGSHEFDRLTDAAGEILKLYYQIAEWLDD